MKDKVIILSGGCAPEVQSFIQELRPHLIRGCEGLSFKLVCGGTTVGISGLAGDLAESSVRKIKGVGYLPNSLPRGVKEDTNPARYSLNFGSTGTDFTPMEALQGWTDLVIAAINPVAVKLIAYAGGKISQGRMRRRSGAGGASWRHRKRRAAKGTPVS